LNTGDGFGASAYWDNLDMVSSQYSVAGWRQEFTDMNGDGLPDYVIVYEGGAGNGSTVRVKLNTGDGFGASAYWDNLDMVSSQYSVVGWRQEFTDMNGDGLPDYIIVYEGGAGNGSTVRVKLNQSPSTRLSSLTSSRGHETSITYTPLTDKLVYLKGSDAVYPEQDYVSPLSVVQSVERDDGIGGKRKIEYNYAGAKVDVKRGSFLGFKQITSKDAQRGTETITDYHQDWPFVRRAEKSVRQLVDGTPISEQENTWEQVPQTGGSVDVRLKSQTSKQYEINATGVTP
uniref:toxin TcdB middle/N-terminal domain-containing protein n=1 Tax=Kiloniella majae TaxID=1938558 RepID=UPI0015C4F9AA